MDNNNPDQRKLNLLRLRTTNKFINSMINDDKVSFEYYHKIVEDSVNYKDFYIARMQDLDSLETIYEIRKKDDEEVPF